MQFVVNSINSATEKKFDGRTYLVSPVVMLAAGVLKDVLVTAEEAGKYILAWNGRAVTLGHPQRNGEYVSANTPEIHATETLGQVWNTTFTDGKLKGEIWIDVAQATRLGGTALTVMNKLRSGQAVEVSTGYFADSEVSTGTFNGKPYSAIARNIRPDHLALLPDGTGACSWTDGCGTPRVNETTPTCGYQEGNGMTKEKVTIHEQEMSDRYSVIRRAFQEKNSDGGMYEMDEYDYIAVYENYVIAQSWKTKEWMAYAYTADGATVTFEDALPVNVVYHSKADDSELVTVNQARKNADESFISAVVNGLLSALGRGKQTISANAEEDEDMEEVKTSVATVVETPVFNTATPPVQPDALVGIATLLEKMNQRIDGIDAKLTANADKERNELVADLATNERCPFDEIELKALSTVHLQKLATAYQPADYSLGAGVIANRNSGDKFEPLAMPAWAVAGKES